jgi:uncharacterized protein (TIGR02284 family)
MKTDTTKKVIGDLIETLEDGRKGFAQAADKIAESGQTDIAASLRTFGDQRADFAAELRQLAADQGIELDGSGSMAGAMHRGWISLKDALTGDDPHAVLAAAETGEDHAVGEYRDALDQELPGPVLSVISRQATAVQAVHDNVRTLRDSTGS